MDISGPIRALLPRFLAGISTDPQEPGDPFTLFAHITASPNFVPLALPPFLQSNAAPLITLPGPAAQSRPVYGYLALASALRTLPRMPRTLHDQMTPALAPQLKALLENAPKLLATRALPVDLLWHYWLLVLARQPLRLPVHEFLLKALWQRAWSRGSTQRPAGPLHPLAPDAVLDTVTYHDLCALHAAHNAILLTRDFDLFPPVQQLVDWHVANTQPDHITNEPWALAAFASLDATSTFAPQQLHDATAHATARGPTPILLALLADALAAQEDIANF